jgi:hypothetical protein
LRKNLEFYEIEQKGKTNFAKSFPKRDAFPRRRKPREGFSVACDKKMQETREDLEEISQLFLEKHWIFPKSLI